MLVCRTKSKKKETKHTISRSIAKPPVGGAAAKQALKGRSVYIKKTRHNQQTKAKWGPDQKNARGLSPTLKEALGLVRVD